jgi:putative inorganic carbon (hco3(-)) transporter
MDFKYMFSCFEKCQKYGFSVVTATVLLALSVAPFYVNADFHDTQRLISAMLAAAALCLTIGFAQVSKTAVWLLSAAYVWGLVAVAYSPVPLWSLVEFGLLFSVVLIGICLIPKLDTAQLQHLAVLFAVIHGFYIVHNLTDYTMYMVTGSRFDPYSLANGFSNVRFYGQFLVWTVPFLIGTLAVNPRLPYRKVIVLLLMFDWAFELLALTRAFLVAMAVTLPVVLWIVRERWREYAKWFCLSALGGCVLYVLMLFVIPKLLAIDIHYAFMHSAGRSILNSSGRMELWSEAFQQVLAHPWLGIGPMMTALTSVSSISAHPHNFVLQLLAEWGIPFTTLLLGGAAVGFLRWRKIIRANASERIDLALPVTVSLVAGATAGLFDGLIVMPVSLTYMTIMFAILGCLWRQWTPEVNRSRFSMWIWPVLLAPGIFVAVFAVVNWPYWTSNTPASLPMYGGGYQLLTKLNPRFWMAGHISLD